MSVSTVKKVMVCVECLMMITATIVQAKAHGWHVWVGGARCKTCVERRKPAEELKKGT